MKDFGRWFADQAPAASGEAAETGDGRLLEALRRAERALARLSAFDCGCVPCIGRCRTGAAAEIELEARMDFAGEAAHNARAAIAKATGAA